MRRAAFLDRDGVITRLVLRGGRRTAPWALAELDVLPGIPEAVERLRAHGFVVIVVTNQPDVASGHVAHEIVEQLNREVRRRVPVDAVKVCCHRDEDRCRCRKPNPGMLLEAATEWSIDLGRSFMVGDRWRDVSAGRAAGCMSILIGAGYGEAMPDRPDVIVGSLPEATELILSQADVAPRAVS